MMYLKRNSQIPFQLKCVVQLENVKRTLCWTNERKTNKRNDTSVRFVDWVPVCFDHFAELSCIKLKALNKENSQIA